jgi:hypothetical protein
MTTKTATATKTHRVFDVIKGLYPVTFANVREADPEGLLDIFEGSDSTRDAYFRAVADYTLTEAATQAASTAGWHWADSLRGFDTDHDDDCNQGPGAYKSSDPCNCKKNQWTNNQRWGSELWDDIQQRIAELND